MFTSLFYQFNQLLSDIGGALGLWIGISAITMAEVLQLVIELILIALGKSNMSPEPKIKRNSIIDISLSEVSGTTWQAFNIESTLNQYLNKIELTLN